MIYILFHLTPIPNFNSFNSYCYTMIMILFFLHSTFLSVWFPFIGFYFIFSSFLRTAFYLLLFFHFIHKLIWPIAYPFIFMFLKAVYLNFTLYFTFYFSPFFLIFNFTSFSLENLSYFNVSHFF